jgi:steroid delta-isomerase-like uncharacterized protein
MKYKRLKFEYVKIYLEMKTLIRSLPLLILVILIFILSVNKLYGQQQEANKEVVLKFFTEVINNQRIDLLDDIFIEDYHAHNLVYGDEYVGLDNLRNFLPQLYNAFPDVHYTIGDIISENDKVAVRVYLNGTQKDEIVGIPASNKRIENLSEIFFFRLKNGRIVEGWIQLDFYSLYKKLGGKDYANGEK